MDSDGKIPFSLFTTEHLAGRHQFQCWRDSISVIFDAAPASQNVADAGFKAAVRAFHLGGLMVGQVDFDAQKFVRDRKRAAADGLDHYLVHLYDKGGLAGTAGERERSLQAGDVQILDLARPSATEARASSTVAVVVPRDALPGAGDLHGLVLDGQGGTGGLLADYMRSLMARARDITLADAPLIAEATTDMIVACFQSTAETMARARTPLDMTTLERIQRDIAAHLGSPELHVDALCSAFGISRTRLYRLFEPLGGVASYIQEQRLVRAYTELANPAHDRRRIYDIAFDLGFTSEAHFSRAFRRTFGLSPSDVRARLTTEPRTALAQHSNGSVAGDGYENWVRQLKLARNERSTP
jgi:AraC-like DNA-binding protein